jgi:hypothetical protein
LGAKILAWFAKFSGLLFVLGPKKGREWIPPLLPSSSPSPSSSRLLPRSPSFPQHSFLSPPLPKFRVFAPVLFVSSAPSLRRQGQELESSFYSPIVIKLGQCPSLLRSFSHIGLWLSRKTMERNGLDSLPFEVLEQILNAVSIENSLQAIPI